MKKIVLLILSLLSLNLWSQDTRHPFNNINILQKVILSTSIQEKNQGFIRLSQFGNNNKADINTKGNNIDIEAVQYGKNHTIDFDIYGKNTYNNIFQRGRSNTFKGKYSLSNKDFSLIQSGKNNYLEIRNSKRIPMQIIQRGKGMRIIIY